MRDGARDALSGYLYQFIQVAALRAAATIRVPEKGLSDDQDGLGCKLIADVRRGTLDHERLGQDAVVRIADSGSDETVAIQFKASRSSTRAEMDMAELVEILRSFDASQREARSEGRTIDRFVLVTNKSLNSIARSALQERHSIKPPRELSRRIKANLAWVRDGYESRDDALQALHAVLSRFDDPIENVQIQSSVRQLETFAGHLGLRARNQ